MSNNSPAEPKRLFNGSVPNLGGTGGFTLRIGLRLTPWRTDKSVEGGCFTLSLSKSTSGMSKREWKVTLTEN